VKYDEGWPGKCHEQDIALMEASKSVE